MPRMLFFSTKRADQRISMDATQPWVVWRRFVKRLSGWVKIITLSPVGFPAIWTNKFSLWVWKFIFSLGHLHLTDIDTSSNWHKPLLSPITTGLNHLKLKSSFEFSSFQINKALSSPGVCISLPHQPVHLKYLTNTRWMDERNEIKKRKIRRISGSFLLYSSSIFQLPISLFQIPWNRISNRSSSEDLLNRRSSLKVIYTDFPFPTPKGKKRIRKECPMFWEPVSARHLTRHFVNILSHSHHQGSWIIG